MPHHHDSDLPLSGVRVIEFAGIGPGPFAGMMLADMGADVIRIERPGTAPAPTDFLARGRQSLTLNLKDPAAVDIAHRLIDKADALIEGFRPGVMERLGLGPDVCRERNPALVYGRMTGWGQDGPLAHAAGHDLNYIAITGALWATGEADRAPTFPLNLLGDFGGGGMYLAFGIISALYKANRTGMGDTIDAAICDGTSSLMTFIHARRSSGEWQDRRESNLLDGGAPWYSLYECSDGRWITIAALEDKFWDCLLGHLGLDATTLGDRRNQDNWPIIRKRLATTIKRKTRDEWTDILEGTDACFAPVLAPGEVNSHPHMKARNSFSTNGPDQPMPAPRFADAPHLLPDQPPVPGANSRQILEWAGLTSADIDRLIVDGVIEENCDKENTP